MALQRLQAMLGVLPPAAMAGRAEGRRAVGGRALCHPRTMCSLLSSCRCDCGLQCSVPLLQDVAIAALARIEWRSRQGGNGKLCRARVHSHQPCPRTLPLLLLPCV